ncbi:MAG: methionine--tRNA ligase [Syntrophales bacterium]|nr:methionine--tRNA ligase [Syntrophales bacterium]
MEKAYYITTPIYYVNAPPHIGHAYTTIVADVLARYHRSAGYKTFFLTGTDEHGDKIAEAAAKAGMSPKEYADMISAQFRALWPELKVTNDYFIRTTDENHVRVVQYILQRVYDKGDIYFGHYEGHYCVGCERFYKEKELIDGKCPDHQTVPEYRKESNYFFKMSKYQDWLIDYIEKHPDFIRPERYRNEVLAFLREPLEDLCISRPKSRLTWGITLPFDENYVTYVWFDALINYLSGIGYPDSEKFHTFWPVAQHLIAKDILKPHGIYWPTMLKAAGIQPFAHLNVHGYWNVDQSKMSKSLGNVVKPLDLKDKYGLDAFRYFLLREMVFGLDANFSEEAFVQRINSDLANDLGNLVNRILTMAVKFGEGVVPQHSASTEEDLVLIEGVKRTKGEIEENFEHLTLHKALMAIWDFINQVNKYIVECEPWVLARDPEKRVRLNTVIYNLLESLRVIAVMISPFMPGASDKIRGAIGDDVNVPPQFSTLDHWGGLMPGKPVQKIEMLFPRVEFVRETQDKEISQDVSSSREITMEDFEKIDLRVGRIVAAEAIPKSSKLVKLRVDIGEERQIVAGIAKDYTPEELIGKTVVVVANLKPTKLMGIESQGMLLATDSVEGLSLVTYDRPPKIGARVR